MSSHTMNTDFLVKPVKSKRSRNFKFRSNSSVKVPPRNGVDDIFNRFNLKPTNQNPPLAGDLHIHSFASLGHAKAAGVLLEHGTSVNITDKDLRTPLHLACLHSQPKVVELLLAHGANLHAKDREGKSPMCYIRDDEGGEAVQNVIDNHINKNKEKISSLLSQLEAKTPQQTIREYIEKSQRFQSERIPSVTRLPDPDITDNAATPEINEPDESSPPFSEIDVDLEFLEAELPENIDLSLLNDFDSTSASGGTTGVEKTSMEGAGLQGLEDLTDSMSIASGSGSRSVSGSMEDILQKLKEYEEEGSSSRQFKCDFECDPDDLESVRAHAQLVTEDDALSMLAKAREAGTVFHLTDIGKELYDKFAPGWQDMNLSRQEEEERSPEKQRKKRPPPSPTSSAVVLHSRGENSQNLLIRLAQELKELDEMPDLRLSPQLGRSPPEKRSRF